MVGIFSWWEFRVWASRDCPRLGQLGEMVQWTICSTHSPDVCRNGKAAPAERNAIEN
jgi:hypothetical protein